jgi:hypothetical protein
MAAEDQQVYAESEADKFNFKKLAKQAAGVAAKQLMAAEEPSVFAETDFAFKLSKEQKAKLLQKLKGQVAKHQD